MEWYAELPTPDWVSPCGNAVLYNRDCLEVLPLLPSGSVDAVVTDPPWNCGYFGPQDKGDWPTYAKQLRQWLTVCEDIADGQVWFLSTKGIPFVSHMFGDYTPFASVKNFSQMTPKRLPNCWDIAFVRSTKYRGTGRNWFVCNTAGMLQERTDHPTPRSCDVMEFLLEMHEWETVIDPFTGSGTTGVAALRLGRKFIGVEIEPKYFDIACQRIANEHERFALFNETKEAQAELFTTEES